MTDREIAMEIVHSNEERIHDRLLVDGYMFDDQLNEAYICSPVIRELASCIEDHFMLEDGQYVIREEMNVYERSDGVFYYSEGDLSFNEVEEIARQHYNIV